jgi:hypothetical protein
MLDGSGSGGRALAEMTDAEADALAEALAEAEADAEAEGFEATDETECDADALGALRAPLCGRGPQCSESSSGSTGTTAEIQWRGRRFGRSKGTTHFVADHT